MPTIIAFLLLAAFAPQPGHSGENFVERADVTKIKTALSKFYKECGFYPDGLERLTRPSIEEPSCLKPSRTSALENTPESQQLIDRLDYRPYGYKNYELSVRLIWTNNH